MTREKNRNLPTNPMSITDLPEIEDEYKFTLDGKPLVLYDSLEDKTVNERIIVFGTEQNLRALNNFRTWFTDETFQTAPSIFVQMFTILGSAKQIVMADHKKLLCLSHTLF